MKGFFLASGARRAGDKGVGRMVGPEGAGEVLRAEELEVVVDREDFGFSMKVGFGGFVVGSQTDL